MKKSFFALTLLVISLNTIAIDKTWNFSTNPLFPISTGSTGTKLVDDLTLVNEISWPNFAKVSASNFTISGTSFTQRFHLPVYSSNLITNESSTWDVCISFDVTPGDTIKVWCKADNGTATVYIAEDPEYYATEDLTSTGRLIEYIAVGNKIHIFSKVGLIYIAQIQVSSENLVNNIENATTKTLSKAGSNLINTDNLEVDIYNITGTKVLTSTESEINVSGLSQGVYVAKTNQGILKFVK